ncbi:MAG: hypothetical protein ABIR06_00525 [Cyclobacteriaceae bacterium]
MKLLFISLLMLFASSCIYAHGGKKHKKDSTKIRADTLVKETDSHAQGDTVHHHDEEMKVDESKVTAELSDFPSMHPLIVHFAIVLIIVAAAIQLLNTILLRKEIAWIIAALILIGFLAAYFASNKFHPHTHGISEHAKLVLEQHDKWADWTIYTAIAGLIAQIVYLVFISYKIKLLATPVNGIDGFASKLNKGLAIVVAVMLLSSAYCVSRTGHYGAQLVHIEGIGPQGKFLEMQHEL